MLVGNATQPAVFTNRSNAFSGNRFAASAASGSTPAKTEETTENKKTGTARSTTEELLAKLNEYIEKGPIVAMREKILESMGLTEEELKSLPPEKQQAVEEAIAEKIKEMLLRQQELAKGQQATGAKASIYAALNGL